MSNELFGALLLIGAATLVGAVAARIAYLVRVKREEVSGWAQGEISYLVGFVCALPILWLLYATGIWDADDESTLGRVIHYSILILITGIGALYLWAIRPRS